MERQGYKLYNLLTLEIIKILNVLLQFGLFELINLEENHKKTKELDESS